MNFMIVDDSKLGKGCRCKETSLPTFVGPEFRLRIKSSGWFSWLESLLRVTFSAFIDRATGRKTCCLSPEVCFRRTSTVLRPFVIRYQKKHSPTHHPIIIQSLSASSIYHDPQHPPCSNYVLGNARLPVCCCRIYSRVCLLVVIGGVWAVYTLVVVQSCRWLICYHRCCTVSVFLITSHR